MSIAKKILELQKTGYCILKARLARPLIDSCREAFWPILLAYLETHGHEPNRGGISPFSSYALRASLLCSSVFL